MTKTHKLTIGQDIIGLLILYRMYTVIWNNDQMLVLVNKFMILIAKLIISQDIIGLQILLVMYTVIWSNE